MERRRRSLTLPPPYVCLRLHILMAVSSTSTAGSLRTTRCFPSGYLGQTPMATLDLIGLSQIRACYLLAMLHRTLRLYIATALQNEHMCELLVSQLCKLIRQQSAVTRSPSFARRVCLVSSSVSLWKSPSMPRAPLSFAWATWGSAICGMTFTTFRCCCYDSWHCCNQRGPI